MVIESNIRICAQREFPKTLTHLLNTFRKLGINSQSELMKYLAYMPKISRDTWH